MSPFPKLDRYRRADLERVILAQYAKENAPTGGIIAGDILLKGCRSIRFSFELHDPGIQAPFLSLSAESHQRVRDIELARFAKFAGIVLGEEITHHGSGTSFVRTFRYERIN